MRPDTALELQEQQNLGVLTAYTRGKLMALDSKSIAKMNHALATAFLKILRNSIVTWSSTAKLTKLGDTAAKCGGHRHAVLPMRRKREPIKQHQILIRCHHCSKLFAKPVAQGHIARCREQQEKHREQKPWWVEG